jgi:hypothetical protein
MLSALLTLLIKEIEVPFEFQPRETLYTAAFIESLTSLWSNLYHQSQSRVESLLSENRRNNVRQFSREL